MIHGFDVAQAILAVHNNFSRSVGERWLVTDGRVYDWWDLASAWGAGGESEERGSIPSGTCSHLRAFAWTPLHDPGPQPQWVFELMEESGVRGLPRGPEQLGRALDSREFWTTFGAVPARARLERE
jgi:hypothetical protein